jgi:ABC-type multidrug transport system fused ATPase/permease subunit
MLNHGIVVRLSTIVNASRIVYMHQGAALEQGTHQQLMDQRGLYWKLVQDDLTSKYVFFFLPLSH